VVVNLRDRVSRFHIDADLAANALTISYRRGCQSRYGRLAPDSLRVLDLSSRGIQVAVTFCSPIVEICNCVRRNVNPQNEPDHACARRGAAKAISGESRGWLRGRQDHKGGCSRPVMQL
jgi:hypothetical protein